MLYFHKDHGMDYLIKKWQAELDRINQLMMASTAIGGDPEQRVQLKIRHVAYQECLSDLRNHKNRGKDAGQQK